MSHSPIQEIVAVFGQPVAGNPTQYVMEKAFQRAGLDWRFLTLEVSPDDLGDAVRGARAMGFRGFNCTTSHKLAVAQYLDRLTQAAGLIGAVNYVSREGDALLGDNTEGKGCLETLRPICDPAGKRIVVLGAGGAARAVAVELGLAGAAEITIVNRDPARGFELVDLLATNVNPAARYAPWPDPYEVPAETDAIINATPIGLGNDDAYLPVDLATLKPNMVVGDLTFNPADTRLLREARECGCRTIDGVSILVNQSAVCFRQWTGLQPDVELMCEALEEFLGI